MSELIAEARVLVTPDTTSFRALLVQQLATATAGVTAPVTVTPVISGNASQVAAAAARDVAAAETASANAIRGATETKRAAAVENARYARSLGGISSGAASAGLSLVGLRGATLAATGPFLAGAAGAIAFGKAISTATSFNSEIAVLGATTQATGEQLALAAESAREFGRDITLPGVTAGDAAQTITEFAKAGLDLNDAIAATRGGLQLAQAAQLSYADAVTLSAGALNAFGLSGGQAVRVADTLANAANLAQGGIEDTALALRQAAGAAAVVGVSFEDTVSLLTLLARNGLTGSDAGTALRTAFLRLVNPSKEAKNILEDLNVQLRDMNGNVRPEVFAEFAAAQRDLSSATQQANAAVVFGQDAFRAFGFLGREGAAGLEEVRSGLDRTGTAAEIAAARMTGLRGAQENLSNQLTDLGLTVGQFADGPLETLIDGLAGVVGLFNDSVTAAGDFATALKGIIPPAPPGSGFLGDLAKDVVGFTNPITGVTNPIANIKRFAGLFSDESENAGDEIKNGGVELRSALEDSGREAARGAVSFQDQIINGINSAFSAVRGAIEQQQAALRNAQLGAVRRAGGQQSGLEESFNSIVAGGGSEQAQLANLKRQAETQARIIRDAGPNAAGVLLEARREAQAKLAQINTQRKQIEDQILADQRSAAQERARVQEEQARVADQGVLDRQALARQAIQNQITVAEDTPSLQDDINRTQALRALIQRQIAQVRDRITDERARQQAVAALTQQVFVTTQALNALKQAQREQQQANRDAILEQQQENAELRTQIAEAQGNDNAVIAAVNAQIKLAQDALRRAKKGTQEFLRATLALELLRKKRRELLEEATEANDEDAVGGTSLVDLFNRAEEIARGAGNVGFTTAGLQGIRAQPRIAAEVQERIDIVQGRSPVESFRGAADRLVTAIEQLTETIQQSGNSSTVGPRGGLNGRSPQWAELTQEQRFFRQKQAKAMVDHGLVGRSGI